MIRSYDMAGTHVIEVNLKRRTIKDSVWYSRRKHPEEETMQCNKVYVYLLF